MAPLGRTNELELPPASALAGNFTSYQQGKQSFPQATHAWERPFYEALPLGQATHPQTILALEMNGQPLPIAHGAPVRLRVETYLGYKMVKWVRSIELVDDYTHLWDGQGAFARTISTMAQARKYKPPLLRRPSLF